MGAGRRRGPRLTAARRKGGPKSSPRRGACSPNGRAGEPGVLLDSRGLPSMAAAMPMHLLAVSRCLSPENVDVSSEDAASPVPRDGGNHVQIEAANSPVGGPQAPGHDSLRGQTSTDEPSAIPVRSSELRPQLLDCTETGPAKLMTVTL